MTEGRDVNQVVVLEISIELLILVVEDWVEQVGGWGPWGPYVLR